MNSPVSILVSLLAVTGLNTQALAETNYTIGLRANILLGDGWPANDALGAGLVGKVYMADGWYVAASLDAYDYDFERPYRILGISQDPGFATIDSNIKSLALGGALGRLYGDNTGFDWFWDVGIGVGFPTTSNVSGPTESGGMFDLQIDAKTEIRVGATLGASYILSDRWSLSAAARAEHQFLDVSVVDEVSGVTEKVESQTVLGMYLSLNASF